MSEAKDEFENAPAPDTVDFPTDVDPDLATWLNRFEAWQMTIDVTLYVDGFVVSGTPQSVAEYYRKLGDVFERGMSRAAVHGTDGTSRVDFSEVGAKVRNMMDDIAKGYEVPAPGPDADEESRQRADAAKDEILKAPRRNDLLKNVVIRTPSGDYVNAEYWRGRLSHVAGWNFGRPSNMEYKGSNF